jgi:hypothetical protein
MRWSKVLDLSGIDKRDQDIDIDQEPSSRQLLAQLMHQV